MFVLVTYTHTHTHMHILWTHWHIGTFCGYILADFPPVAPSSSPPIPDEEANSLQSSTQQKLSPTHLGRQQPVALTKPHLHTKSIVTTAHESQSKVYNFCHSQPCLHCNSRALPHGDHHAATDDGQRGAPSASLLCEETDWKGELQVEGGVFRSHHGRAKTSGILPTMLIFVSCVLSNCIPLYHVTYVIE